VLLTGMPALSTLRQTAVARLSSDCHESISIGL
jgi:hypothetical protein